MLDAQKGRRICYSYLILSFEDEFAPSLEVFGRFLLRSFLVWFCLSPPGRCLEEIILEVFFGRWAAMQVKEGKC